MDIRDMTAQVEQVSQSYASRFGIRRDSNWFLLKLQEEIGELTQAHLMREGQSRIKDQRPEQIDAGFRAEVADVLAHTLLLAHHHGIDVVGEVERKWLVWRSASSTSDG